MGLCEHVAAAFSRQKETVCLSYGRLMHRSPLKNMQFHYSCSYLSEQYSGLDLSAKTFSTPTVHTCKIPNPLNDRYF
ncbi:MAG: hypothetical protein LBC89_05140 [Bacteroidales bacterium]|jgi:hypothetical protein|nr:hypothetical protein [Bacteroidales bacterium]